MFWLVAAAFAADPHWVAPIESLGGGHFVDAANNELVRSDLLALAETTPRGRAYLRKRRAGKIGGTTMLLTGMGMMGGAVAVYATVDCVDAEGVTNAGCNLGKAYGGGVGLGLGGLLLSISGVKGLSGGTSGGDPALIQVANEALRVSPAIASRDDGPGIIRHGRDLPGVDERLVSGQKANRDAAVVVGLEDYAFIPDVPYAKRDAKAFYDWLLYTRGIPSDRIALLTSGSNEHIRSAVEKAGDLAGAGGTVWVYYAGHGAADPSTGERLLLGDDVRSDPVGFTSRGLRVREVETLAQSGGARPMLVLDTCYSGVGRSGEKLLGKTRFAVPQFDQKPEADGVEWNAAGPDQLSGPLEGTDHGAFTYFVVGALRGWADGELDGKRDGNVSAREANAYVQRALRSWQKSSQQAVWVGPEDVVLARNVKEVGPRF